MKTNLPDIFKAESIYRAPNWYADYPISHIDTSVIETLQGIVDRAADSTKKGLPGLIRILECFLCITDQQLTMQVLTSASGNDLFRLFIGALYSEKFFCATIGTRYRYATTLLFCIEELADEYQQIDYLSVEIIPSVTHTRKVITDLVTKFEALELNQTQVEIWRGWPHKTTGGKVGHYDLREIYLQFGSSFTTKLHACIVHENSRVRAANRKGTNALIEYLLKWKKENDDITKLLDHDCSQEFFNDFASFYLQLCQSNMSYAVARSCWLSFVKFWEHSLQNAGLFSPFVKLPQLFNAGEEVPHVRVSKDGRLSYGKLLCNVPLEVTDAEAIRILFEEQKRNIEYVEKWAKREVNEIWRRFEARKAAAKLGRVREFPQNLKYQRISADADVDIVGLYNDVCATFEEKGFRPRSSGRKDDGFYFFKGSKDISYDLALPQSLDLLPFMALLVIYHPQITPEFLSELELYDRSQQRSGLVQIGEQYRLIGLKRRKGRLAQQQILLHEMSVELVKMVIEITRPIRDYLRKSGSDLWRYMFLASGQGFANPRKVTIPSLTCAHYLISLKSRLRELSDIPEDSLDGFAARFSLSSLRATTAVANLLEHNDLRQASTDLGHARFDLKLLKRYIPKPLHAFFFDRCIRIYQTSLVLIAMKDSSYLLRASGLKTWEQLHNFVNAHSLNLQTKSQPVNNTATKSADKVIFPINSELLVILMSIEKLAAREGNHINGELAYWSRIASSIAGEITRPDSPYEELQGYLDEAKSKADAALVEELIFE